MDTISASQGCPLVGALTVFNGNARICTTNATKRALKAAWNNLREDQKTDKNASTKWKHVYTTSFSLAYPVMIVKYYLCIVFATLITPEQPSEVPSIDSI